ncbi:hypothetical protein GLAREA_06053 [Glarea lozoyensis ATCC 20868]|uniref:Uncharacterized protein n=1 Tax=Glarea lozoyensis (strain ATCC 20868 / MF5171) TaxID=1116229 RepID=S3DLV1_GLAL2|nr:uncharacterized protein GLAREA_06053 [Glarea lozoyensis ATCC 20868]EPE33041.1 hypothetical protein GLAREA_06053 [Glarea lozoyensis ATCC 20868]
MNAIGIQSAFGFDEKRDYELRRMRRTNSGFSSCSSSTYSDDTPRSRQSSCSSEYSESSLSTSPNGKPRAVRFALDKPLPLSLTLTTLPIHSKRQDLPSHGTHTRKRSRADSAGDFAWWAQRRIQQDAEWSAERKHLEKETSEDGDVRHL